VWVLILGCSGTVLKDAPLALKLARNMVRSGHVATEVPPSRRRKASGSNRGKKKKGGLSVCLCDSSSLSLFLKFLMSNKEENISMQFKIVFLDMMLCSMVYH
jgi:hypothetical protein